MRIVINEGTSVENALEILKKFLMEKYENYPIIHNKCNIYISLKNNHKQKCEDNEQYYILSDGAVIDVYEESRKKAYIKIRTIWDNFFLHQNEKVSDIRKQIETDKNYIETAIEKNRKPENVEKRKLKLKEKELFLQQELENRDFLIVLDNAIKNNDIEYVNYIITHKRNKYDFDMETICVFENIDGYTGYFDYRGLHQGDYNKRPY